MASAEEQDAQFASSDTERRLADLERRLAMYEGAGLDRLGQSGYLQFDGIPMRWDSSGMQILAPTQTTSFWWVDEFHANMPAVPAARYQVNLTGLNSPSTNQSLLTMNTTDLTNGIAAAFTVSTYLTDEAIALIHGQMGFYDTITPTQIAANTDNYAPTGSKSTTVWRISSDAARNITGIVPPTGLGNFGAVIILHNIGSFTITLKDSDGSSSAANQFALSADIALSADQSCMLIYDTTTQKWRAVSAPSGAGGSSKMTIPGLPFAFDPSELAGIGDVTVSSNTTYSTEAERIQIADSFTISGANTLTAKQGLLVFCKTFTIDNASGVLTAAGSAGAAPVAQTGGVAGSDAGALASAGGTGANGVLTANNGGTGGTPTAITVTANVLDASGMSQANELAWLALDNLGTSVNASATLPGFPPATSFGLGGRGGGGGGGGGGSVTNTGGNGGSGGAATSFLNAVGGVFGAGGGVALPGSVGTAAVITTFSAGWEQLFTMVLAAWYYGAGTGGGGGGSGGNNAGNGTSGAGGGGGAGGNPILIICDTFNNSGTIRTSGGNGGNGGGASGSSVSRGEGGGGGGGGAGALIILARNITNAGTLQAAAGANGTGATAQLGQNGGDGAAGTTPSFSAGYLLVRAG